MWVGPFAFRYQGNGATPANILIPLERQCVIASLACVRPLGSRNVCPSQVISTYVFNFTNNSFSRATLLQNTNINYYCCHFFCLFKNNLRKLDCNFLQDKMDIVLIVKAQVFGQNCLFCLLCNSAPSQLHDSSYQTKIRHVN